MPFKKHIITIFAALLCYTYCYAQIVNQFHIDKNNGLPSNLIYGIEVDDNGYLWLATDHGVVRYNGYECKVYGMADGMPTDDVWGMKIDKKKRMWLFSISDGIGYIYNNKYKRVPLSKPGITLYPKYYKRYGNGIAFNAGYDKETAEQYLAVDKNDSLQLFGLNQFPSISESVSFNVTDDGKMLYKINDTFHLVSYDGKKNIVKTICSHMPKEAHENMFAYMVESLHNNFVLFMPKADHYKILNLDNCSYKYVQLPLLDSIQERISWMYNRAGYLYIITNRYIYKYIGQMELAEKIPVSTLVNDTLICENNIPYFVQHPIWGNIIGTKTAGVFINYKAVDHFEKNNSISLDHFSYLGTIHDSISYWWNNTTYMIAHIICNKHINYSFRKDFINAAFIAPYSPTQSLLIAHRNLLSINNKDGALQPILQNKHIQPLTESLKVVYSIHDLTGINDMIVIDSNSFYLMATGNLGLVHANVVGDTIKLTKLDADRYTTAAYDSLTHTIIGYNPFRISLLYNNDTKNVISNTMLESVGVRKIEKILIDNKYGNIFLKDYDKLLMYNRYNGSVIRILDNYILGETRVCLYRNHIILTGKFGIAFCKITGIGKISMPIVYPNIKNLKYDYITDVQTASGQVLLNTNKGVYTVNIPTDSIYMNIQTHQSLEQYRFIIANGNDLYNIHQNDTIRFNQKDARLQFDIINPLGNGTVKYKYFIEHSDTTWHDLNANELTLNKLSPDKYYKISIVAHDNAWQSDLINLYVYKTPYWWQTTIGQRLVWSMYLIGFILLGAIVSLVTRNIVTKRNRQRNLQQELELKAIYSQINPHFIFNTLSTGLFFIKKQRMDDAYMHISKFSKLLRAYIKSSRNRFITLEEEITNLTNYIELQQTRFENKFDHEIIVDNYIEPRLMKIPSLLLQPLVENAINHGLFHKEEKGNLKISFILNKKENTLICTIDDDGIGRKKAKQLNDLSDKKRESYGSELTKDLVSIFNNYENMNIELQYIDKESPLTGTIVQLIIKNPLYEQ